MTSTGTEENRRTFRTTPPRNNSLTRDRRREPTTIKPACSAAAVSTMIRPTSPGRPTASTPRARIPRDTRGETTPFRMRFAVSRPSSNAVSEPSSPLASFTEEAFPNVERDDIRIKRPGQLREEIELVPRRMFPRESQEDRLEPHTVEGRHLLSGVVPLGGPLISYRTARSNQRWSSIHSGVGYAPAGHLPTSSGTHRRGASRHADIGGSP